MQVLFKTEFVYMFNNMTREDQRRAKPFINQVWEDLKRVSGPNAFQTLPYQISIETRSKFERHLKKDNTKLDPDDVVFSLVGKGFVMLFVVSTKSLSTLEIWSIKSIQRLKS